MAYEFKFPDMGEGITEGEVISWRVKEGDVVAEDQTLAEIETDKAVVEVPSPRAGRVTRLLAAAGDIIKVGDVIVMIEEIPASTPVAAKVAEVAVSPPVSTAPSEPASPPAMTPSEPVPYTGSVVGRLEEAPAEEVTAGASPEPEVPAVVVPTVSEPGRGKEADAAVLAMPSVRALARELGVDLAGIRGTGSGGRILKQDVEDVAEAMAYGVVPGTPSVVAPSAETGAATTVTASGVFEQSGVEAPVPVPDAPPPELEGEATPPRVEPPVAAPVLGGSLEKDAFGTVERVAFRGIRRTMARRMAESVSKQAQVTTMDDADVTIIKRIRDKEHDVAVKRGVRLTYLAFVVKACTASLKRFPLLNAVLDEAGDEFLLKRYYNIGIAVDTKYGLVVPNIKGADRKSIFQIAAEIVDLVDRADGRRLDLRDLHGGTFTISNYGAIGSTFATPVINYPEVALLGMGRVRELPIVREGQVTSRLMLPLSLTIDHRLIDGAEAARFLNLVIGYLQDPDLLLLEGA